MNMYRFFYLMLKNDNFDDLPTYSVFLLFAGFTSFYVFFLLISYIRSFGDLLFGDASGHFQNSFLENKWVLIFLFLFLILFFFFMFYFFYNLRKFSPDTNKSYFKGLFKNSLITFILILSIMIIDKYINNFNINMGIFFIIIMSIYLLSVIWFSINVVPFIFILVEYVASRISGYLVDFQQKYDNPIVIKFKGAEFELEKILKKLDKNKKDELDEFVTLFDIYSVADYYTEGIKELKKYFGNALNFDKIDYLNLNNKENINEILDQLSFSIPYFIFYGRLEQMKELDMHIKNIINFQSKDYSIAGYQFMNEIIDMNKKIKKYLGDNSFELQPINKIYTKKNINYKKYIIFPLALVISIIKIWYG